MKQFIKMLGLLAILAMFLIPSTAGAWQSADSQVAQWADLNMTWINTWIPGTGWVFVGHPDYEYGGHGRNGYFAGVEGSAAHSWARGYNGAVARTKVFGLMTGDIDYGYNSISGWVFGMNRAKAWGIGQLTITEVNGGGTVMLGLNLVGDTGGYSRGLATWDYAAQNVDGGYGSTSGGGFGFSTGSVSRTYGNGSVTASASNFTMAGAGTD